MNSSTLDYPIWLQNLSNPHLSKSTETLSTTVHSVLDDIQLNDLLDMDKKLASVNVLEASPSHLVAVLTSLFTWRFVLLQWPLLRDRAYAYYQQQNLKGLDNAFKGLL